MYVPRSIWGTTNARQYLAMRFVPGILFGVYDILYYFPFWAPMALFAVHAAFSIWWAFGIWRLPLLSNVVTSHAARAGVHSGGPVHCAVMGGERPSFDVFGTAVVIAVKLQETCPPGKVALSGETHALVDGRMTELTFEPRGEIFLESIGNHQAWTAAPRVAAFASLAARVSLGSAA